MRGSIARFRARDGRSGKIAEVWRVKRRGMIPKINHPDTQKKSSRATSRKRNLQIYDRSEVIHEVARKERG